MNALLPDLRSEQPDRFHQERTVSQLTAMPRSNSRSSSCRKESGYRTYIITEVDQRLITSGELLK